MSFKTVLCAFLALGFAFCLSVGNGQKITVKLYNMEVLKKSVNVTLSGRLVEQLPEIVYDKLVIENQFLEEISEEFLQDLDVYILELDGNKISKLHENCFSKIQRLTSLSLKWNQLTKIPAKIFNNLNITTLDLSHNKLTEIDAKAFDSMPKLINLQLSYNNITNYNSEWFYKTPKLARLEFSFNQLQSLPDRAFENLSGEKSLNELPLKLSLHFSHNNIGLISHNAFTTLTEIDSLWLDHNKIKIFNGKLLENILVRDLRLDGNEIPRLTGNWKDVLKNIPLVNVDSNPFDCDFVKEYQSWSKTSKKHSSVFYSEMNCAVDRIRSKMDDLQKRLKELKESRLKFQEDNGINPEAEVLPELETMV